MGGTERAYWPRIVDHSDEAEIVDVIRRQARYGPHGQKLFISREQAKQVARYMAELHCPSPQPSADNIEHSICKGRFTLYGVMLEVVNG